jgi:hypothetical protein
MDITQAQKDVRETFLGGFVGQLVSAALWAASAAACTWHSLRLGEWVLLVGGLFIFPLTQLALRGIGHAYALPKGHPMNALGMQVAFTLPFTLLLVIAIAALHSAWFYPAVMVAVGAHYLPFIFMYGMWQYGVLSGTLIFGGVALTRFAQAPISLGAWFTAALLFLFALLARYVARAENPVA